VPDRPFDVETGGSQKGREASRSSQEERDEAKKVFANHVSTVETFDPATAQAIKDFFAAFMGKSATTKPSGRGHMARAVLTFDDLLYDVALNDLSDDINELLCEHMVGQAATLDESSLGRYADNYTLATHVK